jgi:hypothetical protein
MTVTVVVPTAGGDGIFSSDGDRNSGIFVNP